MLSFILFVRPIRGLQGQRWIGAGGLIVAGALLAWGVNAPTPEPVEAAQLDEDRPVDFPDNPSDFPVLLTSEVVNDEIETDVLVGADKRLSVARQIGAGIAQVRDRLRSGAITSNARVRWAMFQVRVRRPSALEDETVGSFRVPLSRLQRAAKVSDKDYVAFLDMVDHTERGPQFQYVSQFCHDQVNVLRGMRFCDTVSAWR